MNHYIYKIQLIPLFVLVFLNSCTKEIENTTLFKVTTDSVIVDNSINVNNGIKVFVYGNTDQLLKDIIERGVCYSETPNPTIENNCSKTDEREVLEPNLYKTAVNNLKGNTIYHFRNYVQTEQGLQYGNNLIYTTTKFPFLSKTISKMTYNKVDISCNIISDAGTPVISSGIVWSKSKNPTIELSSRLNNMSGSNIVISGSIVDLETLTTYYGRCYAINIYGVSYSNEIEFMTLNISNSTPVTDIDGNEYQTIVIGNQIWMCENLKTTRYRNGDIIQTTTPAIKDVSYEYMPKYQWIYNGDETNLIKFGRLYTWYTVTDSRKIAPEGWHVPTVAEFDVLEKYLIENGFNSPVHTGVFSDYLGKALASSILWEVDNTVGNVGCNLTANNFSKFNANPAGIKIEAGKFDFFAYTTIFWSTDAYSSIQGYGRQLCADYPDFWNCYSPKFYGCSVRCIKDISSKVKQLNDYQSKEKSPSIIQNKNRTRF